MDFNFSFPYAVQCSIYIITMYNVFQHVPGHACNYRIQVFHVLEHQGTGGETLLVDGFFAAETLRQDNPTAFKCLSETVVAHEFYDSDHRVRSLGMVLSIHPTTKKMFSIRYTYHSIRNFKTESEI